ncbi:MAG: hypothetical protein NC253_11010 [Ruminococcus sp.]|nr:hypothetical protein [Ruminococcus sp.]MCM1382567.1 hypothetical protein [Muribaculaceae bacterium]MCM1478803.1 hypothetical protein [Muribaculaceae bacterium]
MPNEKQIPQEDESRGTDVSKRIGIAKGEIIISEDFDLLDEEISELFYNDNKFC